MTLYEEEPFLKSLTFAEERFRASYQETRPGQAWQLNQNPDSGFGASSTDKCLPTIIANVHLLYSDRVSPSRWLTGSELLVTQGFPVLPGLWGEDPKNFPVLCSFNIPRPSRTSRHLRDQAGDSMNTMVMTMLALHSWMEWPRKPLPSLFSNIRKSRNVTRGETRAMHFDNAPPPKRRLTSKRPAEDIN